MTKKDTLFQFFKKVDQSYVFSLPLSLFLSLFLALYSIDLSRKQKDELCFGSLICSISKIT